MWRRTDRPSDAAPRRRTLIMTERTRREFVALLGTTAASTAGCASLTDSEPTTATDRETGTATSAARPTVPPEFRFRRWLAPLWRTDYVDATRVGYQLVDLAALTFAEVGPSRGNSRLARTASDAGTDDSVPLAGTYRTDDLEAVVVAKGPTDELLDGLTSRGYEQTSTGGDYAVYRRAGDGETALTYVGGENWSVYLSSPSDAAAAATADLLATRTGDRPSWAAASPATRPVFADAYTAAESQAVLFPPSAPGPFEGTDGDLLAGVASTRFPGEGYATAELRVTLAFTEGTAPRSSAVETVYDGRVDSASRDALRLSYWPDPLPDPTVERRDGTVVVASEVDTATIRPDR